jgi:chlorite dismutase
MSETTGAGPHHGGEATRPTGGEDLSKVDVLEHGAKNEDGSPQTMNRRLFFQLLVFDCGANARGAVDTLAHELTNRQVRSVIYEDVGSPGGVALLTYDEDPSVFVKKVRDAVQAAGAFEQRQDFTMMGRTYSQGYERDLAHWLIDRPRSVVEDPEWPWAVWYPLRRTGAFARLEPREQAAILREHAIIGRAYGEAGLAHDVRLACHGLDARDNEFVIGLIGKDLHPLSHVVQAMRKTKQTSEYIAQMGPFFVGYAARRT